MDVPKEFIWRAWTRPEHLKPWFCPLPWTTIDCEIGLCPGGIFRTVMRLPEGQEFPGSGCYLEGVENKKLVWTNALRPGYRPASSATTGEEQVDFKFTVMITLASQGGGTKYTATVIHADEAGCKKHAAMGFHEGRGKALDQLVALAKEM